MLKEYPKFKENDIEVFFNKLPSSEKKDLKKYFEYRVARGLNSQRKLKDINRMILQIRFINQKPLSDVNSDTLLKLISIIKTSHYSDYQKNEIIINLKSYLKWKISDWSKKLKLDDIRLIKNPESKRKITSKDLFEKEEIEKLIKHETKLFWKGFLLIQYEGGLRTKEVRYLKWDDIKLNSDNDLSEINIFSTKTKKSRTVFVKESTFYLQKLREEQRNLDDEGQYIFHSKKDKNTPICQTTVSLWMKRLIKRVLGRDGWNYLLRHSRGSDLYRLSKLGKISKDTAVDFMGHSEKMSKVYTHLKDDEVKQMMKDQVYNIEDLPPVKKIELEQKIENLQKMFIESEKRSIEMIDQLKLQIKSNNKSMSKIHS